MVPAAKMPVRRLLTIGHSYVVTLNRRLADEMAIAGAGRWSVTAAAPATYAGDLGTLSLEPGADGGARVVPLGVRLDRIPHLMHYSGLPSLLAERWDVIHCWEEPYVAACLQIARRASPHARFVFATFQNLPKQYPPPFSWIERRVLDRADGWIAFGHTVHDAQARRPGYGRIPSRIIPPGVDTQAFTPDSTARARIRLDRGWDESIPVVGFLGRFVPQKGLPLLLRAIAEVTVPWRALFVGGGPDLDAIRAFAAAHPRRVSIATGVAHADVPAHLNAMDVLCAPSQTTPRWREQFGRMLIEAMACGVPVLASRSGEIPCVVGDAGVLLPEDDVAAWTAALTRVLTDAGLRRTLADQGLVRARTEYGWPVVARRHLAFFDELAGTP